jgi:argonaute-like protein implicated in RNA metabolism and viral defense
MSTGLWDELSGGIINLLNTLSTVDNTIAIFDHGKTNIPAYPAIQVTPNGGPAVFADTSRNQRSYIFNIDCYQERSKTGEQLSEQIMRQLVDSVITLFDANTTLDQVNGFGRLVGRGYCKPIPSTWKYVQTEQPDVRMATILLECVVIV